MSGGFWVYNKNMFSNNDTLFERKSFSSKSGRYNFLLKNYKNGNILDLGNIGGLEGGKNGSNSAYFNLLKDVKESVVYGYDLHIPTTNSELYQNQSYGDIHEGLPYQDNFFDTVYMGQLIEHLHSPGNVLKEIHRVMKKDGVLILDTPNAYSLRKFLKYLLKGNEDLGDPTHLIIYTPASLCALLRQSGFTVFKMNEKVTKIFLLNIFNVQGTGDTIMLAASK